MTDEDHTPNYVLVSVADVILKLRELDQSGLIAMYKGYAKEFTSDYGWEVTEDDCIMQLFSKGVCV